VRAARKKCSADLTQVSDHLGRFSGIFLKCSPLFILLGTQCPTDGSGLGSIDASLSYFGGERIELPAAAARNRIKAQERSEKSEAPARLQKQQKM